MQISFWAIAISIIVGIASNLLTTPITNALGKLSSSIKIKNEQKKKSSRILYSLL